MPAPLGEWRDRVCPRHGIEIGRGNFEHRTRGYGVKPRHGRGRHNWLGGLLPLMQFGLPVAPLQKMTPATVLRFAVLRSARLRIASGWILALGRAACIRATVSPLWRATRMTAAATGGQGKQGDECGES